MNKQYLIYPFTPVAKAIFLKCCSLSFDDQQVSHIHSYLSRTCFTEVSGSLFFSETNHWLSWQQRPGMEDDSRATKQQFAILHNHFIIINFLVKHIIYLSDFGVLISLQITR